MFGQFSDWLSTQSSFCSHVFTVWVLVMMAFTRAFSQDPVTAQICSTRKSLKPVVFRHSSTVQGGVSKRNKRACYIAVSSHCPMHLITGLFSQQLCCDQFVSCCWHISASATSQSFSGHAGFQSLYLTLCLRRHNFSCG